MKPIAATLMCLLIISLPILAFLRSTTVSAEEQAPEIEWTRQFGTSGDDEAWGVAAGPQGEIYVSGYTLGTFLGQTSAGSYDAFVRKYDSGGNEIWTRQFGTPEDDKSYAVAAGPQGEVYVSGYTLGALPGQTFAGGEDVFLRKYDSGGNEIWTRQFGTPGRDYVWGVAAGPQGEVYVSGYTNGTLPGQTFAGGGWDAFVRKYDSGGNEIWTRQFGTSADDLLYCVAAGPQGEVYVSGYTSGTLPGQTSAGSYDAFVRKYDSGGNEIWTRQFGSSTVDLGWGLAAGPQGEVYVSGWTLGTLPGQTSAGVGDAFLRKYDSGGNEIWTRQFGTPGDDWPYCVAAGPQGEVYVSGWTYGTLPGHTYGVGPSFLRKYDSSGNEIWTRQFYGMVYGVAGPQGGLYVSGWIDGTLPGQTSAGGRDAFVVKFAATPNQAPDQPSNASPSGGEPDVSLTPTLTCYAFSDPDVGDTHAASQWQIREATAPSDYSVTVFDSGTDTTNLTSIDIPSGYLSYDTTYYWHVRHQDNHGAWSPYSSEWSFATVAEVAAGSISGAIYEQDGTMLVPGATISAYDYVQGTLVSEVVSSDRTYTMVGLPAGDYKVKASCSDGVDYVDEWYQEKTSSEKADRVRVKANQETPNIDFTLSRVYVVSPPPPPENAIVDDSQYSGAIVEFHDLTGPTQVSINLSDTNPGPDITGFQFLREYYGIVPTPPYTGSVTVTISYEDTDLKNPKKEDKLQLKHLVNGVWDPILEENLSRDIVNNTITGTVDSLSWFAIAEESAGDGGVGGGGCFIATAAYGSYLDSHVETLRNFRDQYLLTNPVGSALVSVYYDISPQMAEFIDDHPALKPVVRAGLLPAVGLSEVAVNTTSAEKIAIVGSLLVSALAILWMKRRAVRKKL